MSMLKISWVGDKANEWGEGANKTYYYQVAGEFEGESKQTSIGVKDPSRKPTVGQEIEGHFETVNGKEKFRKDLPGRPGGFQPRTEDPEKQAAIIRQNALTNAVSFLSALATLEKDPKLLTTDGVLLVAAKFAKFSQGAAVPEAKPVAVTPPPKRSAVEVIADDMPKNAGYVPSPEEGWSGSGESWEED